MEEFCCHPSAVLVWEDRMPWLGAGGEAWLSLPFQDPGYTLAEWVSPISMRGHRLTLTLITRTETLGWPSHLLWVMYAWVNLD